MLTQHITAMKRTRCEHSRHYGFVGEISASFGLQFNAYATL